MEKQRHPSPESGSSTKPSPTISQKLAKRLGFTKTYNLRLFLLTATPMLTFTLLRLPYLRLDAVLARSISPGDWYYYRTGWYRFAIALHLATILPVGILMIPQFLPLLRSTKPLLRFHKLNGYTIWILVCIGNIGALMVMPRAFGGGVDSQSIVVVLVVLTQIGMAMAWYNVRRYQLDQHRAWMLRTMFWLGAIVSTRVVMPVTVLAMTWVGGYFTVIPCPELAFLMGQETNWSAAKSPVEFAKRYPSCVRGPPGGEVVMDGMVAVQAWFEFGNAPGIGAAFKPSFGMALWLCTFFHTLAVEIYLSLTPLEAERLRRLSYHKQLAAGLPNPGSAGTTVQGWGDAGEWTMSGLKGEVGR
ncbi:MAG: hypothetical protein L6R36_006096 [Xanthoria steineri]|nr:MAG: hypothetical protein L6R36_006096 [Xanthoria steineri]